MKASAVKTIQLWLYCELVNLVKKVQHSISLEEHLERESLGKVIFDSASFLEEVPIMPIGKP